jgi:membrane associated rhomboid family serine protease
MIRKKEYYRIFSHAFIHADLWHLLFNMFSFYSFAFILESYLGHTKFFIVYFGSILASVYTCILKNQMNPVYRSLGASGGVSGVIFSFILFQPMSKIGIMFIPVGIPAFVFGFLYLAYSYYSAENQYDNINHEAHFYGAVAGLVITAIFEPGVVPHFIQAISN